ncbi:hypothetical protein ACHAWF_017614 [Thalassiosira exigua]
MAKPAAASSSSSPARGQRSLTSFFGAATSSKTGRAIPPRKVQSGIKAGLKRQAGASDNASGGDASAGGDGGEAKKKEGAKKEEKKVKREGSKREEGKENVENGDEGDNGNDNDRKPAASAVEVKARDSSLADTDDEDELPVARNRKSGKGKAAAKEEEAATKKGSRKRVIDDDDSDDEEEEDEAGAKEKMDVDEDEEDDEDYDEEVEEEEEEEEEEDYEDEEDDDDDNDDDEKMPLKKLGAKKKPASNSSAKAVKRSSAKDDDDDDDDDEEISDEEEDEEEEEEEEASPPPKAKKQRTLTGKVVASKAKAKPSKASSAAGSKSEAAAKAMKSNARLRTIMAEETLPEDAKTPLWEGTDTPYAALCEAFSKVEAVSGRLEIQGIATELFRKVLLRDGGGEEDDDEDEDEENVDEKGTSKSGSEGKDDRASDAELRGADLRSLLYLTSNSVAPQHANVELGVGDSILIKAIGEASGTNPSMVKRKYAKDGDLGTVAQTSKGKQRTLVGFGKIGGTKRLTVGEVLGAFREIGEGEASFARNCYVGFRRGFRPVPLGIAVDTERGVRWNRWARMRDATSSDNTKSSHRSRGTSRALHLYGLLAVAAAGRRRCLAADRCHSWPLQADAAAVDGLTFINVICLNPARSILNPQTQANTSGSQSQKWKADKIKSLLVRAKGVEPKYIIRGLQGKLRIGLAQSTVLASLAHAVALTRPRGVRELDEGRAGEIRELDGTEGECAGTGVGSRCAKDGTAEGFPSAQSAQAAGVAAAFGQSHRFRRILRA